MAVRLHGGQSPDRARTIVASVYGRQGAGKTTFLLTFPPPLWIFNCDRPMGHLLEKLPETTEIVYDEAPLDVDASNQAQAREILARFDALLAEALREGRGSFLLDGADILWDYVKLAKLPRQYGEAGEPLPREWAEANAYMNQRLQRLCASPLQVGMSAIARKVWEGARRETDRVEPEGYKHRGRWITFEAYLYTPESRDLPQEIPVETKRGQTHMAYVTVSKVNESLVGAVFPSLTFRLVYRMVYGEPWPEEGTLWVPS